MVNIPVSYGELFDKISILEIKKEKIKSAHVAKELKLLQDVSASIVVDSRLINQLKEVNVALWNIEDEIRVKEQHKEFDKDFVKLARSVYIENDKRADIKRQINIALKSDIVEEKQYIKYA